MAYTSFRNGFKITSAAAIDERIVLTKAEMKSAEDKLSLPDVYFAFCSEDGKLYVYNKNNANDETTGRFRIIDDLITFDTTPQAKENLDTAIKTTETVKQIQEDLDTLKMDGGEIEDVNMDGGEII